MNALQTRLLQQLMRAAARDLERAYSATWSRSRLYTVLAGHCRREGHQVVEPVVHGTPAYLKQAGTDGIARAGSDLQISQGAGGRLLFVDLLTSSTELSGREGGSLTLETAHSAISRVLEHEIDALLVVADAA